MGSFESKERWKIYLDEPTRKRIHQIQDHLENNYDGPSHYVQQKIKEENVLSAKERLEKFQNEREKLDKKIEQLQQVIEDRNQQDKLQTKVELLKEKQDKLRNVAENGIKSREEVAQEELEKRVDRGYDLDRDSEIIQDAVNRRLERRPDVDELVESVEVLQREIKDLDPESDVEFMDLETVEEVKA